MKIARSVAEVLSRHTTLTLECIDRMYLNVYVPLLQTGAGVAYFFRKLHGRPVPSSVLMAPLTPALRQGDPGLRRTQPHPDRVVPAGRAQGRPDPAVPPQLDRRRGRPLHRQGAGEGAGAAHRAPPRPRHRSRLPVRGRSGAASGRGRTRPKNVSCSRRNRRNLADPSRFRATAGRFLARRGVCRVEGRRVAGRESVACPALSQPGRSPIPMGTFPPPALRTRRAGFRHRALQWNHSARTRAPGHDRRAGLANRWHTKLAPLRRTDRCGVRPVDALTTATARVVPFACECDDVRHFRSSPG